MSGIRVVELINSDFSLDIFIRDTCFARGILSVGLTWLFGIAVPRYVIIFRRILWFIIIPKVDKHDCNQLRELLDKWEIIIPYPATNEKEKNSYVVECKSLS